MRDPVALPARGLVAMFPRAAQDQHRHDRQDHPAEHPGEVERVDERHQPAVGQHERRHYHQQQHTEAAQRQLVVAQPKLVENIGQEAAAQSPVRGQHRTQREDVGGEERPLPQRLAPGDGGHVGDVTQPAERDHRHRHRRQQNEGHHHTDDDRLRQLLRLVGKAARHFRHDVLRREAEHHHVENRHHIAPVTVQQVAHLGGVFQQRCRHQRGQHHHHADADELLAAADRFQTEVQHAGGGHEEQQAAQRRRDAEQRLQQLAAAGHVGGKRPDAVDAHRSEHQPGAQAADVALRQPAQLQMRASAQRGFGDVQHSDGGQAPHQHQPEQQRQETGLAGGVGDGEHPGADVGADDHRHPFEEA